MEPDLNDRSASAGRGPPWPAADGDDADRQIGALLIGLPPPGVPADLAARVLARVKRRRQMLRGGAMAAAVVLLLAGWRLLPGDAKSSGIVDPAHQEALLAQWDQLLDEAAAVPAPVIELEVLNTQRELLSALQRMNGR